MSVTLKLGFLLIYGVYHMVEVYKIQLLWKNDESSAVCRSFSEKPRGNLVKTERSTTIYKLQNIINKEAPLNFRNFKTKPPNDEWSTPCDRALQNTAFVKKNHESSAVCRGFSEKIPTEAESISY